MQQCPRGTANAVDVAEQLHATGRLRFPWSCIVQDPPAIPGHQPASSAPSVAAAIPVAAVASAAASSASPSAARGSTGNRSIAAVPQRQASASARRSLAAAGADRGTDGGRDSDDDDDNDDDGDDGDDVAAARSYVRRHGSRRSGSASTAGVGASAGSSVVEATSTVVYDGDIVDLGVGDSAADAPVDGVAGTSCGLCLSGVCGVVAVGA